MGHWNEWDDTMLEGVAGMENHGHCRKPVLAERVENHCCDHGHHQHHREIPVGDVTVDCTPATFRTPGQAVNIVSCPVTQVLNVPVTRDVKVQVPLAGGCVLCVPLTEQVIVPVVTTVNLPPVLTPVPRVVCPTTTV